jgi:hypothetical protein
VEATGGDLDRRVEALGDRHHVAGREDVRVRAQLPQRGVVSAVPERLEALKPVHGGDAGEVLAVADHMRSRHQGPP